MRDTSIAGCAVTGVYVGATLLALLIKVSRALTVVACVAVPLGIWKMVDLGVSAANHVHVFWH